MTIAVMKFVCEMNKIQVDAEKIVEFMHTIFPKSKDYQMSKTSIENSPKGFQRYTNMLTLKI